MYGLTDQELAALEVNADRIESGLSPLERRFILNAARAGNTEAIRVVERLLVGAGYSRAASREKIAALRTGADTADDRRAFDTFMQTIQGLKL